MRVAILGQFPLDPSRLGGVEVAIYYLMDSLQAVGVDEVHVITCRTDVERPQTATVRGATVHYLPRRNLGRLTWHLREVGLMKQAVRDIQPNIVHAHSTGLYAGAALAAGYPHVITAHGIVAREVALYKERSMRLRGRVDVLYERRVLAQAQDIIAISPYVEREFRGMTRARFHVVENAVDRAFLSLQPRPEDGRILFAGPVIERKGLLPLFQALAVVKQQAPLVQLRIAGGTEADLRYYRLLQETAAALGIGDNVHFLGLLDQERLLDEYARCALFVLPSFQETSPMALEQALAAAAPVVATKVGGVADMAPHGVSGLLVDSGDTAGLAAALTQLLQDGALRRRMGAEARRQAEQRFRPEVVAAKTKAVYDEILARSGKASLAQGARI